MQEVSVMRNIKIVWIARTAIFIALLIVSQVVTMNFGNTLVTGSVVNFVLAVSVMTCGLGSGLIVAGMSPVFARILGIGPFWVLIPFIAVSNMIFVSVWHLVGNYNFRRKYAAYILATGLAAFAKFLLLYIGIARVAVPIILDLPEPQATIVSSMFSLPQLVTALVGGVLAASILPTLKKVIK